MGRSATQCSDITQTAMNRAYTIQCGRCQAVIGYDTRTNWPTVSLLVNEHLDTCPAKFKFHGPTSSYPPSETFDTQNTSNHNVIENLGANNSKHDNQFIAGCRKKKSEAQRKQELEDDEYTYSVCPTSVRCHGCEKEISLDKRFRYCPGLWTKHRRKCRKIRKMECDKLDKPAANGNGVCPWSVEWRSTATSLFKPGAEFTLRVANSVESNVSRQTELSDDGDLEDGDQDIPFSTLNEQFYNECRQRGDGLWAYRYSTTKEIKERTISIVYFDIATAS